MKKFFTLIAMAMLGLGSANAQNGVVELSWDTMVKDEAGTNAADQANTEFWADEAQTTKTGFILTREDGSNRTQAQTVREYCGKVLNAQNNKVQKLVIPAGTKVYKINFYGWSQGDNWTYLYAYGPSSERWEWTDPIGGGISDNDVIIGQAKYPLDPCVISDSYKAGDQYATKYPNGDRIYHNAGYCFASLDFSDEAYEGEFSFVFNGNNQERFWMVVYTTKEAAAAAPAAEPATLGKDKSQTIFIDAENNRQAELKANTVELSWDTMVKDEAGTNAADQGNTEFWTDEEAGTKTGFILTREDGSNRTQAQTVREGCGKVLNAQNNKVQKLVIPAGTKVYKINFYGWSQGDNWTYLYAYGPSSSLWEWTDPIGGGISDNDVIIEQAKYPLDPCVISDSYKAGDQYATKYPNGDRIYHNAGYCFASLDFNTDVDGDGVADPLEGEFCFLFNGNNQERFWMVVYTSPEAAAAAEQPEAVQQGKENSVTKYIEAAAAEEAAKHEIVGAEDNSAEWWTAFSSYNTIPANKTLHMEFTNYSSKAQNWNNWLVVLTNNVERGADGYSEYCVLRADNYGWQGAKNTANDQTWFTSLASNYNWDTFKDEMDGSKVVLEVKRLGATVTIRADITATSGNTYFEEFVIDCGDGTQDVGMFLTTEQGHLDIYKPSISIFDTPNETAIKSLSSAQPVKSAAIYNLAGQRVDKGYKGIAIQNGRKYVVK